jgi:HD-like signal output (HDOD) protein
MKESEKELQTIDRQKIKTAIKLHTPIEITTYTLPRNMDVYIRDVTTEFLEECNQQHMNKYLGFCLGELLTNAKKANTKRIYFREKNLDINNSDDYKKGMLTFKEDTLNNIDYYMSEQKKAGLYVKLNLLYTEDNLIVEIRNNSLICKEEKERIEYKLKNVKQYKNENDVFKHILDQTEGAGLGIIIIILMLQKVGLKKENYKVYTNDTETITKITLPLNTEIQTGIETACLECVKTQTKVPVFEEELEELSMELKEVEPDKKKIVNRITKDVTLTALLLKTAAKLSDDCCKISKAIELIGFNKLSEIFNKDNPDLRLIKKSQDKKQLWKKAYTAAFYAYNFVLNFAEEEFSAEEVFVFALLHDIENILMEVITKEQAHLVRAAVQKKGVSQKAMKMVVQNCCTAKGGCIVTKNWGFPSKISEAIRYHNNPEIAPKDIKKLISLLYLADMINYYSLGEVEYYQINEKVLKEFSIDSEGKLKTIVKRVQEKLDY